MLCPCGRPLPEQAGAGRKRRYCSEACKQKAKRVRSQEKRVTRLRENRSSLYVVPLDLNTANEFVTRFHRHNRPVPGAKLCIGVADETGLLRGAAIVGRPVSRMLDDGRTLEVTRVVTDGCPNACSLLYATARSVVFTLGYARLVTYTLQGESGASLRGAGWKRVSATTASTGKGWLNRSGRTDQPVYTQAKYRWEALPLKKSKPLPFAMLRYPWDVLLCDADVS